jgi:hypothetical protein
VRNVVSAPVLPDLKGARQDVSTNTQLLRLQQQGRDIILEGGMPLLEDLSEHSYVHSISSDRAILGFESPSGAANMVDIAVGKV